MYKKILIALLFSLVSKNGYAQLYSLSLEDALELGIKKNEDVQKAKSKINEADAAVDEAYSYVFPKLDFKAAQSRYYQAPIAAIGGTEVRLKRNWETDYGATLKQLLWAFGRVSDGIDMAKSYEDLSGINKDKVENDLVKDISRIYFATLLSEGSLKIQEESLQNAKDNKSILEKRFQSGRIPVYDSIKMDSDIASRVPGLEQTKKELNERMNTLKYLLGLGVEDKIVLTDSLSDMYRNAVSSEQEAKKLAHEVNPTLRALSKKSEIAKQNIEIERKTNYPTLSAFVSYGQNANHDDYYLTNKDLNTNLVVGLLVNVNLIDGGNSRAKASQARAQALQSDLNLQQYKRNLDTRLNTLFSSLESLERTLAAQKIDIKLANKTFELTRRRYESGTSTQKDLNDAELRLSIARLKHQGSLYELAETKLDIDFYTANK